MPKNKALTLGRVVANQQLWCVRFQDDCSLVEYLKNNSVRAAPIFFFLERIFNIYLFIWLLRVLVAAGRLLSCSMRTLSCGMHVGSSSLTRDRTRAPCIGSVESYPLHHQGSPSTYNIFKIKQRMWKRPMDIHQE